MGTEIIYFMTILMSFLSFFIILYYVGLEISDTVFLTLVVTTAIARWLLSFNNFFNLNHNKNVSFVIYFFDSLIAMYIIWTVINFALTISKRSKKETELKKR